MNGGSNFGKSAANFAYKGFRFSHAAFPFKRVSVDEALAVWLSYADGKEQRQRQYDGDDDDDDADDMDALFSP